MGEPSGSSAPDEEKDGLFVFGYECKVFRDDEKAKYIEDGRHLIPCMGDASILVDRYDCRGALTDLAKYEPESAGSRLSPEDEEIERACEKERYRDYREDQEFDETAYQEEQFKRLQQAVSGISSNDVRETPSGYAAIGYSYSEINASTRIGPEPKKFKDNSPYVKPPGLFPPPDVTLPDTMKSHAIIEKTAKFIAQQDGQMEIILKTKQAKNPQFEFLNFTHPLNAYYKFLVTAIQTCAYQPSEEMPMSPEGSSSHSGSDDDESSESGDHYLHPSLFQGNTPMSTLLSNSTYKPTSAHSAYSMLVSKIKEVSTTISQSPPPTSPSLSQETDEDPDKPMPSSQEKIIIDKMASYVIKNGAAFESLASHKGDPRFMFLDPEHPFHWYYVSRKDQYRVEAGAVVASRRFVGYDNKTEKTNKAAATTSSSTIANLPPAVPKPNHANALNRMATLPPELISKIEGLRRKALLNRSKNLAEGTTSTSVVPSPDSIDIANTTPVMSTKPKREQVIRISPSLSHRVLGGEPEWLPDTELHETLEMHNGNTAKEKSDSDEVSKQKEERRKKVSIFLQKLKEKQLTEELENQPSVSQKTENEKENQGSDVDSSMDSSESLPSPVLKKHEIVEAGVNKLNDSTLHETSLGQTETRREEEISSRLKDSTNDEIVFISQTNRLEPDEKPSKHRRKRIKGREKSTSRSLSSDDPDLEPRSSSSHKKKSKSSKHSKKRKRHEKSHSHSKKSSRRDKYN